MGEEATPESAGYRNEVTNTQVKGTGENLGINHSGCQRKLTSSASGDRSRRKNKIVFDTQYIDFSISTPYIGAVLALRNEKLEKKVPFDTFRGGG